ncbi:hypothetical protein [Jiangella endophytica]|uniref:hypothetical protein n=1 Tax=Jiangella endophytica TaxID=1623398 RepID=UPI0013004248|nr:hypothetical protein [Jiangella endophytica]
MFRTTLTGEPLRPVVPDEDVARGRARQRRMRRQRVAGGVALLAVAGLGAAVLPAVFDDDRDDSVAADGAPDGGDYPPAVGDDPVKQVIWDAVESALPADVEVVGLDDPGLQGPPSVGAAIGVQLERGDSGTGFQFGVTVEKARTDLGEFRPCSEPGPLEGTSSQWRNCSEGSDDGVWQAAGDLEFDSSVVMAQNDDAAVIVTWSTRPFPLPGSQATSSNGSEPGSLPTGPSLDRAESEAVRDAVLAATAELDSDDLTSGADLGDIVGVWPEVHSILEDAVGAALTAVDGPAGDPAIDLQDVEHQVGTVSANYVTADGVEVEVWFWQRPRITDTMCIDAIMECAIATGSQELLGPAGGGGENHEGGGSVGPRGQLWLRVTSDEVPQSDDPAAGLAGAMGALGEIISALEAQVRTPFPAG